MNLVAVFTGKNLKNGMSADGGSGHWSARTSRVSEAKYLLCVRNRRESWAETDFEHGTAFLVARISGTSASSKHEGRIVINFTEYAEILVKDAWRICTDGQRYPVAYLDADKVQKDLGLDFTSLDWKVFNPGAVAEVDKNPVKEIETQPAIIQKAKMMLANALNVPEENIEITIKF